MRAREPLEGCSRTKNWRRKIDTTMTKLAALTSELEAGKGTAGKLFKDEALYNNANQMLSRDAGPDERRSARIPRSISASSCTFSRGMAKVFATDFTD
jgi:hypothetical protein